MAFTAPLGLVRQSSFLCTNATHCESPKQSVLQSANVSLVSFSAPSLIYPVTPESNVQAAVVVIGSDVVVGFAVLVGSAVVDVVVEVVVSGLIVGSSVVVVEVVVLVLVVVVVVAVLDVVVEVVEQVLT